MLKNITKIGLLSLVVAGSLNASVIASGVSTVAGVEDTKIANISMGVGTIDNESAIGLEYKNQDFSVNAELSEDIKEVKVNSGYELNTGTGENFVYSYGINAGLGFADYETDSSAYGEIGLAGAMITNNITLKASVNKTVYANDDVAENSESYNISTSVGYDRFSVNAKRTVLSEDIDYDTVIINYLFEF